tara:strand:+ start:3212 stop:3577 length:366 start_codon:yes stop_codon:yes gene_type:complete
MDELKIAFDLDGVICSNSPDDYNQAIPNKFVIQTINKLKDQGHHISIYTSRYMGRLNENLFDINQHGFERITKQLKGWGVKYDRLILGKPRYDLLIDDKAFGYKDPSDLKNHLSSALNIEI